MLESPSTDHNSDTDEKTGMGEKLDLVIVLLNIFLVWLVSLEERKKLNKCFIARRGGPIKCYM